MPLNNREEIAQRGREDLYFLCKHILGYDLMEEHPHSTVMTSFSERIDNQPENRKFGMLLCPRGAFKTSVLTIGRIIQEIINDPNTRVMLASETYTKAASYLNAIKSHLRDPEFIKYYGDMISEATIDREGDLTVSTRTKHFKENTIECTGVGKAKTGMHYDLMIFDDLVSKDNTKTQERIKEVNRYFTLSFAMLDPGKTALVVGTRWHQDDLYDFIEKNLSEEFVIEIHGAINKDGVYFFPERLNDDFLKVQRKILGATDYSAQYMNNPMASEDMVFKPHMIQWFGNIEDDDGSSRLPDPLFTFIFADPSMGENPGNDGTGLVAVGVDSANRWIILDAIQERLDPHVASDIVIDWVVRWKPIHLVYETLGVGKGLKIVLETLAEKRGVTLPFHEVPTNSNTAKTIRIQSLEPVIASSRVFFPVRSKDELFGGLKALYDQMMAFRTDRRPKKCDALDAFSNATTVAFAPARPVNNTKKSKSFDKAHWRDNEEEYTFESDDLQWEDPLDSWHTKRVSGATGVER